MSENQVEAAAEAAPEAEAPSTAESLLAKHTVSEGAEENANAAPETTEETSEVKMLAGRFKTEEELERGYEELRKKLSESGRIAPDEYTLELPEEFSVADDDPVLDSFKQIAKERGIDNETFNQLVKFKLESDASMRIDPAAEMEKLGNNAGEVINNVTSFYKNKLSADAFEKVQNMAVTAEAVQVLDELRKTFSESSLPTSRDVQTKTPSVDANQAEAWLAESTRLHKEGKIEEAAMLRSKARKAFDQLYS